MGEIFNNFHQTDLRRELRQNSSAPEQRLWSILRVRQLEGLKFRRQASVGRYVVDFYCPEVKLVVEVDGDSHAEEGAKENDEKRTEFLRGFGLRVIRFTNNEIMTSLDGVAEEIVRVARSPSL